MLRDIRNFWGSGRNAEIATLLDRISLVPLQVCPWERNAGHYHSVSKGWHFNRMISLAWQIFLRTHCMPENWKTKVNQTLYPACRLWREQTQDTLTLLGQSRAGAAVSGIKGASMTGSSRHCKTQTSYSPLLTKRNTVHFLECCLSGGNKKQEIEITTFWWVRGELYWIFYIFLS